MGRPLPRRAIGPTPTSGPIDDPEAIGRATGIGPEQRYPDFVTIAKGFGWQARYVTREDRELVDALARDDRLRRARTCWTCRCPIRSTCCR